MMTASRSKTRLTEKTAEGCRDEPSQHLLGQDRSEAARRKVSQMAASLLTRGSFVRTHPKADRGVNSKIALGVNLPVENSCPVPVVSMPPKGSRNWQLLMQQHLTR